MYDENTKLKLKKVLHEPVAPYFANTYNTLISVVQSLALGALLYIVKKEFNLLIVLPKSIVTFGVICVIWHRYVINTQYIAWRLSFLDTLIPMCFALGQFWLILTIPKTAFDFSLALICLSILGFFAYLNATLRLKGTKLKGSELKGLLDEHFMDKTFSKHFFQELYSFEKGAMVFTIVMFIVSVILTAGNYFININSFSEEGKTYVTTAVLALMIFIMIRYDLRHKLKESKESKELKKWW